MEIAIIVANRGMANNPIKVLESKPPAESLGLGNGAPNGLSKMVRSHTGTSEGKQPTEGY
jgi:hypothetical protein